MKRYQKTLTGWVDTRPDLCFGIERELFPHEDGLSISPTSGQLVAVSIEVPIVNVRAQVAGRWQDNEFYPLGSENIFKRSAS